MPVLTCPVCDAPSVGSPRRWTSRRQMLRIVRVCPSCGTSVALDESTQRLEVLHPDRLEGSPTESWPC